ncbi:STAS/SEC14 domain-containing protein [Muricauda sp. 334s03]|uniref:STAS/SEC14 domain-containing protein n=2 Tax=Flavobacteriaceae TaxID=49546 RepID=A0A3G2L4J3_9FLAO|nr:MULTISPECIES: STAS/SEC14 domain-containing protein [Bacteroidota]AYN67187.1 STAS/SEC14 domain-containing protein [Euzebyella marina]MBC6999619.1 STAS/SEC14 domain-containing protein [Cytophaga sp. FL35]MDF0716682.1 STAS/SEC14 domain-containing protein [[Muricauda] yonaguniensis]
MIAIYKKDRIIYTIADKELDTDDRATLIKALNEHLKENEQAAWYMEMGLPEKRVWKSSVERLDFSFSEEARFKKIALVGDKIWQERFTESLLPFSEAHIKFFGPEDGDMANNWLER